MQGAIYTANNPVNMMYVGAIVQPQMTWTVLDAISIALHRSLFVYQTSNLNTIKESKRQDNWPTVPRVTRDIFVISERPRKQSKEGVRKLENEENKTSIESLIDLDTPIQQQTRNKQTRPMSEDPFNAGSEKQMKCDGQEQIIEQGEEININIRAQIPPIGLSTYEVHKKRQSLDSRRVYDWNQLQRGLPKQKRQIRRLRQ